jgi:hypothetical protein
MKVFFCCLIAVVVSGCATSMSPPPATSKSDAIARAQMNYTSGNKLELPANSTGTGPHDFYNLFARLPVGWDAVYGISVVTATNLSQDNARVSADGFGNFTVEGQRQLSAPRGKKVEYIEATFSREFLEQACSSGATLHISTSGASLSFAVPDWMFAALRDAADQRDLIGTIERKRKRDERDRQEMRGKFVQTHPELAQKFKDAVIAGTIVLGMPADATKAAWGEPSQINRTVNNFGVHEQWIYRNTYVYFEDGILSSWQESR